ncbi:MAG TPA: hypothetical protein EYH31_08010 [Anaerolineae bacterium]|nr:hypothetical protein [Anaerolineae bacterium]
MKYKTLLAITAAFIALLGSGGTTGITWDRRQQENHTVYLPFVQTAQPLTGVTICGTVSAGECPDSPVVELWFQWYDDAEASDIIAEVPVANDGRYCVSGPVMAEGWIYMIAVSGRHRYELLRWPPACWITHFVDRVFCPADHPAHLGGLDWEAQYIASWSAPLPVQIEDNVAR